jgi:murein L,D-transpeptidase YafK
MVRFSRVGRAGLLAAAGLVALALAACSDYGGTLPKHMRPLDSKTRDLVERKGMEQRSPILIRIFKEEATLEVWKLQKATGRYAFLKDYEICAWSGVLGPKVREGDRQAPEGFYNIRPAQMNPDSSYYLAFNMGYPNEFDRSLGRTGSELMVHGACSSRGCYSMTDGNIQEIYTLGRLAFQGGQRDFQVQAYPFRMTAEHMARHRNDPNMPFWLMLKEGYDHFEAIGQPPKVNVCEHRYIFNSVPADGRNFDPSGQCPPMSMPEPFRIALGEKAAKENERMLSMAARLDRRESSDGAGALRLALATPTSVQRSTPLLMSVATAPVSIEPSTTASVAAVEQPPASLGLTSPATASPVASPAPVASVAPVEIAPAPAPIPVARPEHVAVATAPAAAPARPQVAVTDGGFLPIPDLSNAMEPAPAPAAAVPPPPPAAPATPAPDTATLEERMLAGSTPADASVANAYADASAEEEGLTGMVLKLIRKEQDP